MDIFISQSTAYELTLLLVFSLAILIQLFYYLVIYSRLLFFKRKGPVTDEEQLPSVSIVICARNEESNLEQFLPLVLEQKYPEYEVVVVDDCSSDDTDMVLKRLSQKYKHLRTTAIKPDAKFSHGKKLALTIGIKAAKYDWLLLTDADCRPESDMWIATMATNFQNNNLVVLGYGGYIPSKGFLNKLIRIDTFFIALQYLSFALFGKPYMGVGRNLAYKKELFFQNKGFASHSLLNSGDDDLFIQQIANKKNTVVEYRAQSHTRSVAHTTFGEWFKQKKRHLTTGPHYRASLKFWLVLEPFSRLLFWVSGILLIALGYYIPVIAGAMGFRVVLMFFILNFAMNRLKERKIFILSLVYDLFSPLLFSTLMLANRFTKKRSRWN